MQKHFETLQVEKNIKMWYAYHQDMRRSRSE